MSRNSTIAKKNLAEEKSSKNNSVLKGITNVMRAMGGSRRKAKAVFGEAIGWYSGRIQETHYKVNACCS